LIKRAIILALVLFFGLATPLAAAESDGVISGQVVNGSPGGGVTANLELTLEALAANATEPVVTPGQADDEGNFSFTGLNTDTSYTYFVTATYLDITYYSQPVTFAAEETAKTTEVDVYETTEGDADLSIALSHTIILADTDGLSITEFFIFQNGGGYTYIGSEEALNGARITALLPIPSTASNIQLGSEVGDNAIFTDQGLAYIAPIIPGYTQVTYAYRIDGTMSEYTFTRRLEITQSIYEFLVQGAGQIESQELTRENSLTIQDVTYDYFSGESVPAGQTVTVQLSGLPQDTSQQTVLWVLVTLIVLGGGLAFFLRRGGRRMAPEARGGQEEQLLSQIARLDDEFEAGEIDEEDYRLKRSRLKNSLVRMRQRPGVGGE